MIPPCYLENMEIYYYTNLIKYNNFRFKIKNNELKN